MEHQVAELVRGVEARARPVPLLVTQEEEGTSPEHAGERVEALVAEGGRAEEDAAALEQFPQLEQRTLAQAPRLPGQLSRRFHVHVRIHSPALLTERQREHGRRQRDTLVQPEEDLCRQFSQTRCLAIRLTGTGTLPGAKGQRAAQIQGGRQVPEEERQRHAQVPRQGRQVLVRGPLDPALPLRDGSPADFESLGHLRLALARQLACLRQACRHHLPAAHGRLPAATCTRVGSRLIAVPTLSVGTLSSTSSSSRAGAMRACSMMLPDMGRKRCRSSGSW